jgi:hypothetical protein
LPENSILGEGDLEMKYRVVVILLILLALTATPVLAKKIEDQIYLWWGPTEFDADTPFVIRHGWSTEGSPGELLRNGRLFVLYVDGVKCEGTNPNCSPGIPRINRNKETGVSTVAWEYKFMNGMPPGENEFHGEWYGRCADFNDPGDCVDPEAIVVVWDLYLTVDFDAP